jgi:hypothetical protein
MTRFHFSPLIPVAVLALVAGVPRPGCQVLVIRRCPP